MLVLTRKKNQVILIGDGIEIHVTYVNRNIVKLGIVAPGLRIIRAELDGGQDSSGPADDAPTPTPEVPVLG